MGTGVLELLGRGVENRYVQVAQTRTWLLGRRTLRPRLLDECAIPTSRQNLVQIQYLNPKPEVTCCACAQADL